VRGGQVDAFPASEVFAGLLVSARRPACCSYIVKRRFVRAPPRAGSASHTDSQT